MPKITEGMFIGVHLCPKCLGEMKIIRNQTFGWIKRICLNCKMVYIPEYSLRIDVE